MDDADFADDGDDGVGEFDFDLGEIAAFRDFLAGFIGSVPKESVGAGTARRFARPRIPSGEREIPSDRKA